MKKGTFVFLTILLIMNIMSCEKSNDLNIVDDEEVIDYKEKISLDSIYFSCKINGEHIELYSASLSSGSLGKTYKRLYKISGNEQDSAIIGYYNTYYNDDYSIKFGISGVFLVDTMSILGPDVKGLLYAEGEYPIKYLLPSGIQLKEETSKYYGYYIEIINHKNDYHYSSFLGYDPPENNEEYNKFKAESTFQIKNSNIVQIPIDDTYVISKLLVEFSFNCNLYNYLYNNSHNNPIKLTDGVIRAVL